MWHWTVNCGNDECSAPQPHRKEEKIYKSKQCLNTHTFSDEKHHTVFTHHHILFKMHNIHSLLATALLAPLALGASIPLEIIRP